ncbi:MAG TPA: hypothetical protein VJU16_02710 [Planctomycetota bacterium]|nr:hypothetical protein [Planctomycetota bacterium]
MVAENSPEDAEPPDSTVNYWQEGSPRQQPALLKRVIELLPTMDSWDQGAVMFGFKHGHQVEIWDDDFICKFDARDPDTSILVSYARLALQVQCRVVQHEDGKVLDSNEDGILVAFKKSKAGRFIKNPQAIIRETRKQRRDRESK